MVLLVPAFQELELQTQEVAAEVLEQSLLDKADQE
jgi:hypothetical protein